MQNKNFFENFAIVQLQQLDDDEFGGQEQHGAEKVVSIDFVDHNKHYSDDIDMNLQRMICLNKA